MFVAPEKFCVRKPSKTCCVSTVCVDRSTRPWPGVTAAGGGGSLFFLRKECRLFPCDLTASLSACGLLKKGGVRMCSTSGSNRRCSGVPLLLKDCVGDRKGRIRIIISFDTCYINLHYTYSIYFHVAHLIEERRKTFHF